MFVIRWVYFRSWYPSSRSCAAAATYRSLGAADSQPLSVPHPPEACLPCARPCLGTGPKKLVAPIILFFCRRSKNVANATPCADQGDRRTAVGGGGVLRTLPLPAGRMPLALPTPRMSQLMFLSQRRLQSDCERLVRVCLLQGLERRGLLHIRV
jgi:hypothetical protein